MAMLPESTFMKSMFPIIAVAAMATATPAFACASCGCTLTSDWLSQGLVTQPGTTVSIRYDDIPQTDLRTQNSSVDRGAITLPADREIEHYTYNHYVTATVDRQFNSEWGVNVQIPFVYRAHATIAEGDTDQSFSHNNGIGDVRITARWQGFSTPGSINGVQLGLVLPTGRINQTFRSGPQQGEVVDRGLQPGFGVVQAVVGYYRYGKIAKDFDYIVQLQGQAPFNSRDLYRPGISGQASAGVHYTRWRGITPQLQLNFRAVARDTGVNSDHENSGGEQLYAAPGLIANLGGRASAFTYVQLPVYQRVNGYQITPHYTLSVGIQYRL
ncbi:MAG: hypothetical protein JWO15_2363 [Sphingomonadales bacterium]|nr:hypothetical protein [Sphingomonadales bacterium]